MGAITRTAMTLLLFVLSILTVVLVATVNTKMNELCPDDSKDDNCKRPFLNPLLIVSVIVGLLGASLATWKMVTKSQEVINAG